MVRIIIVEDDERLAEGIRGILVKERYDVVIQRDFENTVDGILTAKADLVLLDINIPEMSGERVLRKLRETSMVPVIMLTSRTSEMDEIISMSYGADDFVTKPFNPQILLLRIEAVLGRNKSHGNSFKYKEIEIFPIKSELVYRGERAILTKNELAIMSFLMKNAGQIVSRSDVMDYLWSDDQFVDDNTLTVNINRLRKKLEDLGLERMIQTRRSQGYILE